MSIALLRRVPSLAAVAEQDLALLLTDAQRATYPAGALLFAEGETDERLCVVVAGRVEIIKALGSTDERLLAYSEVGTLLGEMGLFSPGSAHTASVRASEPTVVLELRRAAFDELLRRQPQVAYALVRQLSRRLDEGEHVTIRDLREKNRALAQALHDLETAQAQLVEKERLDREIELARQIQLSMLPAALPSAAGYDLGAPAMVPAKEVAGDFYDALPLDAGRIALAVGDVCGKGFGAAFFMAQCFVLLRVEAVRRRSPGATLRALNRLLLGINRSEMYVTLLYAVLDTRTGRLDYCRAGHPALLLGSPDGSHASAPFRPGQMLGIFDEPLLDEGQVTLAPGSVALLYSDGLTEATDAAGVEAGPERIGQIVADAGETGAQGLCGALWQGLQAPAGPAAPAAEQGVRDDFTVVALKRLRL